MFQFETFVELLGDVRGPTSAIREREEQATSRKLGPGVKSTAPKANRREGMSAEAFRWMRPSGATWRRGAPSKGVDPLPYLWSACTTLQYRY